MTSLRKTALVAGVLYLVTFIAGIPPAAFLLEPVLSNPQYIIGAGADAQVTWGALLDIVNALACIGTAVVLYSVVKRQHEGLALGFITTRMFEAAVIMIGVISLLTVVTLRQPDATGAEAASLVTAGRLLVSLRDWTQLLGPGLAPALNALLLGTLMYRSRLVPRPIPVLGLIGAPLLLSFTIGTMFGITTAAPVWAAIAIVPIFFWELSLGLWMTFKGFNPNAPIALAASADFGSAGTAMDHVGAGRAQGKVAITV
jgi:uncharacterized protein DUF4386